MKRKITHLLLAVLLFFTSTSLFSQDREWMTSLDLAKILARRQNKMILMVWEESTKYPLPVTLRDEQGSLVYIDDLFKATELNDILWNYFIPVKVNDNMYGDLFAEVDGNRTQRYITMFQDDSVKVMDANGNLIVVSGVVTPEYLYLGKLINKYSLNTTFVSQELDNYANKKDFFSAFFLASKYVDFSVYLKKDVRKDIVKLSSIYIQEAQKMLNDVEPERRQTLQHRIDLFPFKQDLVLGKAKKVLRKLEKMDTDQYKETTNAELAFLYYTAYLILKDEKRAETWKSQVSSVNLKKADLIANINK